MEQDRTHDQTFEEWQRISRERQDYWRFDSHIFDLALRAPDSMTPEVFDLIRRRWEQNNPDTHLNLDRWLDEHARPRYHLFSIEDSHRKLFYRGIDYTDPFLAASRAVINFIEHYKNPPQSPEQG